MTSRSPIPWFTRFRGAAAREGRELAGDLPELVRWKDFWMTDGGARAVLSGGIPGRLDDQVSRTRMVADQSVEATPTGLWWACSRGVEARRGWPVASLPTPGGEPFEVRSRAHHFRGAPFSHIAEAERSG